MRASPQRAFKIGTDDKHIAPIDEGGVALVAIKGLDRKPREELTHRDTEIAELKLRLAALAKLVAANESRPDWPAIAP